jgi:hypothetical protein
MRVLCQTAIAFAMNEEFGRTLEAQMVHFNGPSGDSLASVNAKLDDVKNVMVQNIEVSVLKRMVKNMEVSAQRFYGEKHGSKC